MKSSKCSLLLHSLVVFGFLSLLSCRLAAQPFLPTEVGKTVSGFQDDFSGTTLDPNWVVTGADVYSVGSGMLHFISASGDPNHLLYGLPDYDDTIQEVLARVRIVNFGSGDPARGGVGVGVDPFSGQGINYLFRNDNSEGQVGYHLAFLDDMRAWGPGQGFTWQPNTWYWVRLRQEPDAPSQDGFSDIFAKIWLADGSTPEPDNWQLSWDYTSSRPIRAGYAGITAGSSGGLSEFDVDYILIKAAGLPNITVSPSSFVQVPVAITNQPQSLTALELYPASFTVGVVGTAPSFQWYKNGTAIPGATASTYTISSVALADNGTPFTVVARNVISNVTHSVTSAVATLTV
ncbi:MAG TPA: immunoglobulin domain-containing protein, partial [Clostridia bacterium]|nr:immunoglobulin domain-containing protein [Clostridia bacterium]